MTHITVIPTLLIDVELIKKQKQALILDIENAFDRARMLILKLDPGIYSNVID